jgi:hypothetical protein
VYGHGLVPTAIHVADVGDRVSEWCVARAYCGAYVSVIDEDWQAGDVCAECLSLARAVELPSAAHTGQNRHLRGRRSPSGPMPPRADAC